MRREARIRTWRSENFFSSSRVRLRGSQSRPFIANCLKGSETYRCWTRWKPCREGTGTKMTIAFLPWPTSIYSRPEVSMRAPGQALDRFPSCSSKVNSGAGSARARASIHHEARVGNHSILSNRGACLFSLARGADAAVAGRVCLVGLGTGPRMRSPSGRLFVFFRWLLFSPRGQRRSAGDAGRP